jgi:hypothetical protein
MTARALTAALLLALVAAPVAGAAPYDIPQELGPQLRKVAKRTDIPVRVPASMDLAHTGITFASGEGTKRRWSLSLGAAPRCGGATACFLATFTGQRGGTPAFKRQVRLTRGITGYYKPTTCGASCSPALIEWKQGRVLYGIQAKVEGEGEAGELALMVDAANRAIVARGR